MTFKTNPQTPANQLAKVSHRINRLADLLLARESFNSGSLAAELGISYKTVRRDVAYLKTRGWKIEYDPTPINSYRLIKAGKLEEIETTYIR